MPDDLLALWILLALLSEDGRLMFHSPPGHHSTGPALKLVGSAFIARAPVGRFAWLDCVHRWIDQLQRRPVAELQLELTIVANGVAVDGTSIQTPLPGRLVFHLGINGLPVETVLALTERRLAPVLN